MHPLDRVAAEEYWMGALAAQSRDERVVLGAWDANVIVGGVTLLLDFPSSGSGSVT